MSETAPQDSPASEPAPPFDTVCNGRQARGRFAPGNKEAKGNGITRKVARFRASMFAAVKVADVKAVVGTLIEQAKAGEGWAVKLFLEYMAGPPRDVDLDERLTALEEKMKGKP